MTTFYYHTAWFAYRNCAFNHEVKSIEVEDLNDAIAEHMNGVYAHAKAHNANDIVLNNMKRLIDSAKNKEYKLDENGIYDWNSEMDFIWWSTEETIPDIIKEKFYA